MATCFVVMPISTPEDTFKQYGDREHFQHVLDYLFTPALKQLEYTITPPSAAGSDLIHAEIIKNLEQSDLALCDISTLNANVFFELGIRTSLDRPVALVKDNFTTKIPFDTSSINTHTYNASLTAWSLEKEIPRLSEHIADVVARAEGRNTLWRYFGLTQRASPAEISNPTEAKLQIVIDQLAGLTKEINALSEGVARDRILSSYSSPLSTTVYSTNPTGSAFFNTTPGSQYIAPDFDLTSEIPPRFAVFIQRAKTAAARESAVLEVRGYDEARDRVVLSTGNWPLSEKIQKEIDRLAGSLKVKFLLNTPDTSVWPR